MTLSSLVIFDFDDTIVNNDKLDYMGFKIPCTILNLNFPSKKKLQTYRIKGKSAKEIIIEINGHTKKLDKFLKIRNAYLIHESINYLYLKSYSKLLFNKLNKFNFDLIICSANSNPIIIKKFLKKNNIEYLFKDIVTMNDLNKHIDNSTYSNRILIKTKLLNLIHKKYDLSKNNFIFIGNSLEDYNASIKSKIKFIYLLNTYLPIPKLKNLTKVSKMNQIFDIIHEKIN
jgi:phosphoglycolate phosphatase-like HAD superfamily hydrolase